MDKQEELRDTQDRGQDGDGQMVRADSSLYKSLMRLQPFETRQKVQTPEPWKQQHGQITAMNVGLSSHDLNPILLGRKGLGLGSQGSQIQ